MLHSVSVMLKNLLPEGESAWHTEQSLAIGGALWQFE